MQVTRELADLRPNGDLILTIGVFDGVHLGHRHLIGQVVERARQLGCLSGVITFHPHPAAVLRGESLPILTTPPERLYLLRQLDVDVIANLAFTADLASLTAREFVDLICQHLRLRELWVGPDFALGRGREGNMARLKEIGAQVGFTVQAVPPLVLDGEVVSSTRIRAVLAAGDVVQASRLLGHCFSFSGPVIHGAQRGRALGYPTANLAAEPDRALPANGIYACHVFVGDPGREDSKTPPGTRRHQAVVNVGTRPTFDNGARLVEAYILDFDGDLYGQTLTVHFVERLRGELRFSSVGALVDQIGQDVLRARQVLATDTGCMLV